MVVVVVAAVAVVHVVAVVVLVQLLAAAVAVDLPDVAVVAAVVTAATAVVVDVVAEPQAALAEPSIAPAAVVVVLSGLCSCQMFCRVPCCSTAEAAAHCLESGWGDS